MEELNLTNESTQEIVDNSVDYISAINEMKKNSVSRDAYNKLKSENARLINALKDNKLIENDKPKESIEELKKKVFTDNPGTNLEYISNSLKLRDALIAQGKQDPFLPYKGPNVPPEPGDIEVAENVANILQEMVDYADGDNAVFIAEYQRRVYDPIPGPIRKGKK